MTPSHDADGPRAPVAAMVVVLAALLVGAGVLAGSSVLAAEAPRVGLAVVLVLAGWWVARLAHGPAGVALGRPVLRGVGTSFGVLGAYLGGLALLVATEPSAPVAVVSLVYGGPALALLAVARTGMRAWTAGAGAVLVMVAVLLLSAVGVGAGAVSVTMLAVGVVLAVVVVRSPAASVPGDLASAAAATATSFAVGAGTSPLGSLGATQVPGVAAGTSGTWTAGGLAAVVAGALLVASVLLIVAVLRRDVAGGLLAGMVVTVPPLTTVLRPAEGWPAELLAAVTAIPALVALTALVAIRVPAARRALVALPVALRPPAPTPRPRPDVPPPTTADAPMPPDVDESARPEGGVAGAGDEQPAEGEVAAGTRKEDQPVRSDGTAGPPSGAFVVAGSAVVVAGAGVVFVVAVMPLFGWGGGTRAAVALVVLAAAGALGSWLPGAPGAAAAVAALVGLAVVPPWAGLVAGGPAGGTAERVTAGVLTLGAAAGLAWHLTRRHRRPAVHAAATYVLAGAGAAFAGSLLYDGGDTSAPAAAAVVVLPLLLLGVAVVVAVLRGHLATGQAAGAVVLAAGAFVPLTALVGELAGGASRLALGPLAPTDWYGTSLALHGATGVLAGAIVAMVALALALAASLALRPAAALAAAVALTLLVAVQLALLLALTQAVENAELLGRLLGALAALAAVLALVTGRNATR